MAACTNAASAPSPIVDVGQIDVTGSSGVAWIDQETLAISRELDPTDIASPRHLYTLDIPTGMWTDLDLPSLADCSRTDYAGPERLPDGRIGAIRTCYPHQINPHQPTVLVAVDPLSRAVEELTQDLSTGTVVRLEGYAWSPSLTDAVVSRGSRICQMLLLAEPTGLSPIDLVVSDEGGSFNLREMPDSSGGDCDSTGQAEAPTRSPDGKMLVFAASTRAKGVAGSGRLDAPYNLFVLDEREDGPRVFLRGVSPIYDMRFSPVGDCVSFDGEVDGMGRGTFLASVNTGEVVKVFDSEVGVAWSPDGGALAGNTLLNEVDDKTWLVILPASCALVGE
jgi:hypothetical protein